MSCANLPGPPGRNVSTAFDVWARSDEYHNSFLLKRDPALDAALSASDAAGLPQIAVSAAQGKFLMLLARTIRAKRILEVGTLGGYSTIWLARALPPEGRLITCELKQEHADVARKNLAYAGFEEPRIQILVGPAVDTLRSLDTAEPFDLVFIDADKKGNLEYMREAKRLTRSEGAIIVDNVVRQGRVSDPSVTSDTNCEGVRALLEFLKDDPDIEATTIATVGEKGHDGFMCCVRK